MESLVIRVDANSKIGAGHLMRCLALAQAWKDAGGKVIFVTACRTEGLLQRIREEGFDIHLLDGSYPDASDWDYTKNILATHADAWVVLDGYNFDEIYQQRVKEAKHRLLVIDDMAHLNHYYADIVLNQNLGADKLHYSCEPYTHLLLGTRYILLRGEFLARKDWKGNIPEVAQRVLVTMGGSDPENITLKVIEALQKIDVVGLEATVVTGAGNPHTSVMEMASKQSRVPIRLIHNAKNMPDLMAWADVAVSAGGSTVWELAFMGLPSLILVWAENQRLIAKSLADAEVALNLGWYETVTSADVSRTLAWLLNTVESRTQMSHRGQKLVDGSGGQRVISTMVVKKEGQDNHWNVVSTGRHGEINTD